MPQISISDALGQTNQTKYDCFLCMAQKTHTKKYFLKTKKQKQKGKNSGKNYLVKLELSKEIFLSQEYPDFWSKF